MLFALKKNAKANQNANITGVRHNGVNRYAFSANNAINDSVEIEQYEYEVSLIQAELTSLQLAPVNGNISSTDIKFNFKTP